MFMKNLSFYKASSIIIYWCCWFKFCLKTSAHPCIYRFRNRLFPITFPAFKIEKRKMAAAFAHISVQIFFILHWRNSVTNFLFHNGPGTRLFCKDRILTSNFLQAASVSGKESKKTLVIYTKLGLKYIVLMYCKDFWPSFCSSYFGFGKNVVHMKCPKVSFCATNVSLKWTKYMCDVDKVEKSLENFKWPTRHCPWYCDGK